jgi:1,4-dihydroxy-6-naphthoate synthase
MTCGASMGDGYGPCVVARRRLAPADLHGATIAVPGTLTSAWLALSLYLGRPFEHRVVAFDRIPAAIAAGEVDAGLIIHESQLTYASEGLHLVVDLGVWWAEHTGGLPLPLGANVVRRDLGREGMASLTAVLRDSIDYGLAHRDAALDYALGWGRGLARPLADRFVGMYVNDLTRDYGERGRRAIDRFLGEAAAAGHVPRVELEFVGPGD